MEQHLTVREACEFTGKSESTIKRLIREITADPKHPDRVLILPPPEEVERRKKSGDVFVWKINQDLLTRRFPKQPASEQGSPGTSNPAAAGGDSQAIIQVLRDQLQSKDRQLQTLETQLDRKDEQIKSLNDRMHESNVLMRELQARLSIAAPAAKPTADGEVVQRGSDVATAKDEAAPGRESKSRSFFGRLFRKT